jgi:hypothetical protein
MIRRKAQKLATSVESGARREARTRTMPVRATIAPGGVDAPLPVPTGMVTALWTRPNSRPAAGTAAIRAAGGPCGGWNSDRDGKVVRDEFARGSGERLGRRHAREDDEAEEDTPRTRGRSVRGPADRERAVDIAAETAEDGAYDAGRSERRVERQFRRLDQNGDGVIDAAEFEAAAIQRITSASERFFKRFDANGDGKVSKAEFRLLGKERVANRKPDGDGQSDEASRPSKMRGGGDMK